MSNHADDETAAELADTFQSYFGEMKFAGICCISKLRNEAICHDLLNDVGVAVAVGIATRCSRGSAGCCTPVK